ncbi:MAG: NAD-dependent epimerase/dehydratase [Candidatus Daviesbacteria bacterium GW2011_GWF2_38_7]|nr:MAG: NAD-dependent epimerase/dehydratase [Candidatus Daviesbacteria bacterium GW2011_GWF2_38_7]
MGSHLSDKLIERGDQVICIDNLLTGNIENIAHLQNSPDFQFVQADALDEFPQDLDFDCLYHLASPASPNKNNPKSYMALPFETMQVNSFGTWNLCNEALNRGAKFLFASTSEIYGDPLEHPQKETYRGNVSTIGPRAVYDEAKRFGETIVSAFIRYNKLDGRAVRIFNTYGPRMSQDGRVVIEFVMAALQNKPLPVFGDGTQTRSFCYVSDLVDGIIAAMDKGEKGEIFNLGNPDEFTVLQLAEIVKKLTGTTSEIAIAEKLPEDEPLRRCPDISKAKAALGWEPKVELEEGLSKLIVHLKNAQSPKTP